MSTHTSTVTKRIEKARHFEQSISGIQVPDWQAVVYFYAALHWLGAAYEHQTGQSVPDSHREAKRIYGTGHGVPHRVFRAYGDLQSYAEYVRYELDPPLDSENINVIAEQFQIVQAWSVSVLGVQP